MCRGFQPNERDRMKIRSFNTTIVLSKQEQQHLPEFLTLHYPNGSSSITRRQPGSTPCFVTLHRVILSNKNNTCVTYSSRENVTVFEGTRFEVFLFDVRVLKGTFRKGEDEKWEMGCKCEEGVEGVEEAEVVVEGTEGEVIDERLVMRQRRRKRRCGGLEEIPEEREEGEVCGCWECCGEVEEREVDDGVDGVEGVGWAVDVGIWVVCIGVGYLASKRFTRRRHRFVL